MILALDASALASNGRGFARYVEALLAALALRLPERDRLRVFTDLAPDPSRVPERFRGDVRVLPPRRLRAVWRARDLVRAARSEGAVVLHFPDNECAPCGPIRAVSTLHDISPLLLPERRLASPLMRAYFHRAVASVRRNADLVLADSEAAARDLSGHWQGRHPPLRTVPPGLAPLPPAGSPPPGPPYFLFVGALERRKNLGTLGRAFASFKRETGLPHRLLVVGEAPTGMGAVPERPGPHPDLVLLGRRSDAELAGLYRGASALLMPSWYEAFGFPWLEAMAYDCPVIGTTAGAGPETLGDAGLLADPADAGSIAAAMRRVLACREELARKGRQRLRAFTLERMGDGILAAYRGTS